MKEINIASTLVAKRKQKGITQDELAAYIGVSKASVSKWETGQSYPDITFLPQLAAYFNISIDELMSYSPQMTKDDIKKLYHKLSSAFAAKPFDEVLEECTQIIKKYYSCFPLLLQMAVLLINHHMLAKEDERKGILSNAAELCKRIRTESDDARLSRDAVSLQATCYLMLQQPQDVLDLLGETVRPILSDAEIIAQAYQMMGKVSKAKEVTQINMYQHLLTLVGATPSYLLLNADNPEMVENILFRSLSLADIYNLDKLHPNVMAQIYYSAAQVYSMTGNIDKALDMLQKYEELCTTDFFPITLHGDSFFDAIEDWFTDFDLGSEAPRDEITIRESMLQGVLENPMFAPLAEHPRYKFIVEKLRANMKC